MSLSVDDLVSSLSSHHIGQEAIDLQAFKSQMKALFVATNQPSHSGFPPRRNSLAQPYSPPAPRVHIPATAVATAAPAEDEDMMDEDMVEDMLDAPVSPVSGPSFSYPSAVTAPPPPPPHHAPPSSPQLAPVQQPMHFYSHHPQPHPPLPAMHPLPDQNQNLFTSTDPFYLALTQPRYAPAPSTLFAAPRPAFGMPIEGFVAR